MFPRSWLLIALGKVMTTGPGPGSIPLPCYFNMQYRYSMEIRRVNVRQSEILLLPQEWRKGTKPGVAMLSPPLVLVTLSTTLAGSVAVEQLSCVCPTGKGGKCTYVDD